MGAELFFREVRTPYRGLQLVVGTILVAVAVYSGIVVQWVGIYPLDLPLTKVLGLALIVAIVVPLLAARAIIPGRMVDRGLRQIAAGRWVGKERSGSPTAHLIDRTGDVGRLWLLFSEQSLLGALLVGGAAFASLTAYVIDPSAPPLALGTILVVATSSHLPTKPIVTRWMAMHLHAVDLIRQQSRR